MAVTKAPTLAEFQKQMAQFESRRREQVEYDRYRKMQMLDPGTDSEWARIAEMADEFGEWEQVIAFSRQHHADEEAAKDMMRKRYETKRLKREEQEKQSRREGFIAKVNGEDIPLLEELESAAYTTPLEPVRTLFMAVWGGKWFSVRELADPLHRAMFKRLKNNDMLEETNVAFPDEQVVTTYHRVKGT